MINPEKKLWQNVLLTAINDALNFKRGGNTIYGVKIAKDAKNWLLNNNAHYFRVCSMADINPVSLRQKIKEKLVTSNDVDELGVS